MSSIATKAQVSYSYDILYEGKSYKINAQSIVKNADGRILQFVEWEALMKTGNYKLTTYTVTKNIPTEFLVRLLSDTEREDIGQQMRLQQKMTAGISVGKEFPPFSVTDINGKNISLAALRGKVVVLNFWFIQCAPCITEMPHINKIAEEYRNNSNVVFIAITPSDDAVAIADFLKLNVFGYQHISNEFGKKISMSNGIMGFPTNIVLDRQGIVYQSYTGYKADMPAMLRSDIEAVLQ